MNVYFTTVKRAALLTEGGELVRLNWSTKQVEARVPMFPADPPVNDPNPRGNTRGGRGVLLNGSEIFAASYHSIDVYDQTLRVVRRLTQGLFAGLHELAWEGESIWATATSVDCAVRVDTQGDLIEYWSPREDPVTQRYFQLPRWDVDPQSDSRTAYTHVGNTHPGHVHLNALAMQGDRPLVTLNRFGALVRLRPTEIVFHDPTLRGCHNVVVASNGRIVVNDTRRRLVRVFDPDGRPIRQIDLLGHPAVKRLRRPLLARELGCWLAANGRPQRLFHRMFYAVTIARPLFVRGLAETPSGTFLVGLSPATILEMDMDGERIVDSFQYSHDVNVCIHGVACERPVSAGERESGSSGMHATRLHASSITQST